MRSTLAQKKVPRPREAVLATVMLLGGTSILLGVKPKHGAAAILGFLAGVSPIMHDFWRMEDPNQRMNDMINFSKNLALMGGAAAGGATWTHRACAKVFRREIAA